MIIDQATARGEKPDYQADLTVILENSTRWNSAFLSISRGIKLRAAIEVFLINHSDALAQDKLTDDNWELLKQISAALQPFWEIFLRLQGRGSTGSYGFIWEALPALNYLLTEIETQKNALTA